MQAFPDAAWLFSDLLLRIMKIHSSSCCSAEAKGRWNWRVVLLVSTAVVVLVIAVLGFFAQ